MSQDEAVRRQVSSLLDWQEAHAGFEKVLDGIPAKLRGVAPQRLPYTPWQLLEHLRLTQRDILEFCRNPGYTELHWPDDYCHAGAGSGSHRGSLDPHRSWVGADHPARGSPPGGSQRLSSRRAGRGAPLPWHLGQLMMVEAS
jgi:hypothetical protein